MPVQILNVENSTDWPELASLLFDSREDPYQSYLRPLHPELVAQSEKRELEIHRFTESLKRVHADDPTSYAVKAVDTESGMILGLSIWNISTTCQSANMSGGPRCEFAIYADDGETELISEAVEQLENSRAGPTHLPHVCE